MVFAQGQFHALMSYHPSHSNIYIYIYMHVSEPLFQESFELWDCMESKGGGGSEITERLTDYPTSAVYKMSVDPQCIQPLTTIPRMPTR